MSVFEKCNGISPVKKQDFVWLAEYSNGGYHAEFDLKTRKEHSFYNIRKDMLLRFGLVGQNMKLYFECFNGVFKLNNMNIEVLYKTKEKEYNLTGRNLHYNDIITYKDAYTETSLGMNRQGDFGNSTISQFNFGYKQNMNIDGINFYFQPIMHIPFNQPAYFSFKLVSSIDLDGELIIKRKGIVVGESYAPLKANNGGYLNWIIK